MAVSHASSTARATPSAAAPSVGVQGSAPQGPVNGTTDPTQTLQSFDLTDLAQYTLEKSYSPSASHDFHLFYVGRDNVHEILKYVLSRARVSLYLNMFGYDDDELNQILFAKAMDPNVTMLVTLDRSQAGGKHEKALLDADQATPDGLAAFNTHFVIGQSATHQISHTKGFVADSKVGAEGSTNWSESGEGTFRIVGQPGGPGYKAQNNTQSIFTDPDTIARFQAELIQEHLAAQKSPPHPQSLGRQKTPPHPRQRHPHSTPDEPN
jgi:hypothetical protein